MDRDVELSDSAATQDRKKKLEKRYETMDFVDVENDSESAIDVRRTIFSISL